MILEKKLTEKIIRTAIEIHGHLGLSLLEAADEERLGHELVKVRLL